MNSHDHLPIYAPPISPHFTNLGLSAVGKYRIAVVARGIWCFSRHRGIRKVLVTVIAQAIRTKSISTYPQDSFYCVLACLWGVVSAIPKRSRFGGERKKEISSCGVLLRGVEQQILTSETLKHGPYDGLWHTRVECLH